MQGQFDRTLNVARVFPWFQTRLQYAEHYVARYLVNQNVRSTFLTTSHVPNSLRAIIKYEKPGPYWNADYAWHRYRSYSMFEKPVVYPSCFGKVITSGRFQIFHLAGVGLPLTIQFLLEHRLVGSTAPIVISDHTTSDTAGRNGLSKHFYFACLRAMLRPLRSRIDTIVTFSNESADLIRNRFGLRGTRIEIINLGYDASVFRPINSPAFNKCFRIGFAGKVVPAKRLNVLIDAISKCSRRESVELVVAGLTDADSLLKQDLIRQANHAGVRLISKPLLDPQSLCEFYNSLDLAVFPGSISITTLEASGCGVPILLYESIAGLGCRVENGRGQLFNEGVELTRLITSALSSSESFKVRQLRGMHTAKEFSWETLSREYAMIYRNAVTRGANGRNK